VHRDDHDFSVIHPVTFVPIDGSEPSQLHPLFRHSLAVTRPIPRDVLEALVNEERRLAQETIR
jgi:hypothetical protein